MRSFYIANVILCGVMLLAALLTGLTVLIAACGAAFLFMVAGAVQVRAHPFGWSVAIAAIWTLLVVAWVAKGVGLTRLEFLLAALWTIGCWSMLPATARVNKLLAQHPDLRAAKALRPGGRSAHTGKRR